MTVCSVTITAIMNFIDAHDNHSQPIQIKIFIAFIIINPLHIYIVITYSFYSHHPLLSIPSVVNI